MVEAMISDLDLPMINQQQRSLAETALIEKQNLTL